MEKIVSLCKRRGFVFPSSEIYGGFASVYDYGPLGVELKSNIKKAWWKEMVQKRENIVGLDSAIFMHPKTWEASGHMQAFSDPLVEDKITHERYRLDQLLEAQGVDIADKSFDELKQIVMERNLKSPIGNELTEAKKFNLLVEAYFGVTEDNRSKAYLRGETCQGIYLNYENVLRSSRQKIPFGIAQIGKAFRNEITPGNFIFRTREFEQMEMEFFVRNNLEESSRWFEYWRNERLNWYLKLGFQKESLRFREHAENERAHYAKAAFDIEFNTPFGWKEFEGIHNRGDWDLSRHSQYSGQDLSYFDEETKEKYIPWVVETSVGVERMFLMVLLNGYREEKAGKEDRVVLSISPLLSPIKAAVFPLVKTDQKLVETARKIYEDLKEKMMVQYDEVDSVGRRYRRQDEIGTPFCITVDGQTLKDQTVTIRERDSMKQERIEIAQIENYLSKQLE